MLHILVVLQAVSPRVCERPRRLYPGSCPEGLISKKLWVVSGMICIDLRRGYEADQSEAGNMHPCMYVAFLSLNPEVCLSLYRSLIGNPLSVLPSLSSECFTFLCWRGKSSRSAAPRLKMRPIDPYETQCIRRPERLKGLCKRSLCFE